MNKVLSSRNSLIHQIEFKPLPTYRRVLRNTHVEQSQHCTPGTNVGSKGETRDKNWSSILKYIFFSAIKMQIDVIYAAGRNESERAFLPIHQTLHSSSINNNCSSSSSNNNFNINHNNSCVASNHGYQ